MKNRNIKGQFVKGDKQLSGKPFKKGEAPFNKGKKWEEWMKNPHKSREKQFKKGNLPMQTLPEGTITKIYRKKERTYINYINIDPITRRRHSHYSYARFVIEDYLGRYLDSSEIVYHINGKSDDDRLENLEIITRQELARRIRK